MPCMPDSMGTSKERSMTPRDFKRKFLITKSEDDSIRRKQRILEQRRLLPIASAEKRLVQEVRKNHTLVVVGETGSGKTTQLPQFLFNAGFCHGGKVIGITQPRRVAAVTVATRVAEEVSVKLGEEVGYSIRFEDATSRATRIKYMTDGMLLREALLDPLLRKYSVIIVDEAHERTVHTDVLLGLLKDVQKRRSLSRSLQNEIMAKENENPEESKQKFGGNGDKLNENGGSLNKSCKISLEAEVDPLKLVIMSATLDARGFSEYFNRAKAVYVQGRQYPVEIMYTYTVEPDYLDAALVTAFQIHMEEASGDILVFLTGQEEIESMERLLQEHAANMPESMQKLLVVPIYAALPCDQQMQVFKPAPTGFRKVILATNIAETSVTIPRIRYVIDPGLVKARAYDPRIGMESLVVIPISKAQALQRSGRAGREGPGKCFRLYTEEEFGKLADSTVPEIKRCNLSNVVIQLKALGIDDVIGFDFMDIPSKTAIVKSLEHLYVVGALTDEGKLSDPVGLQMARLPLEPLYAKAVLVSCTFKCSEEMLIAISMLSVESIFYTPREKMKEARAARQRFCSPDGDHITFVNIYRACVEEVWKNKDNNAAGKYKDSTLDKNIQKWCKSNFVNSRSFRHAMNIHRQLQGYVQTMGLPILSCEEDWTQFRRCLCAAFFLNAACKQPDGTYRAMANSQIVSIHPSSVLFGTNPDCLLFNELVRTNRNYVRNITRIDALWLPELAPQFYAARDAC
uniref:RNA helicase n=1 Tax=Araucaria cunninghamii TaxID=56994 RepID=A0A0D6QVP3_ARACU